MLAGLVFCGDVVTVPTVCFSGFSEGHRGGQQQFGTQPLRVHLLGLDGYLTERGERFKLNLWPPDSLSIHRGVL